MSGSTVHPDGHGSQEMATNTTHQPRSTKSSPLFLPFPSSSLDIPELLIPASRKGTITSTVRPDGQGSREMSTNTIQQPRSNKSSPLFVPFPSSSLDIPELLIPSSRKGTLTPTLVPGHERVDQDDSLRVVLAPSGSQPLPLHLEFVSPTSSFNIPPTARTKRSVNKKWRYLGLACGVISSLFFSLASAIVKKLENVSPFGLAIFRCLGVVLPALPFIAIQVETPSHLFPKGYRLFLLLRASLGTGSIMLQFYAIRNMPLPDASVIIFSVPVFVTILARIFLNEPCGLVTVVGVVLTSAGMLLIAKPTFLFTQDEGAEKTEHTEWQTVLAAVAGTFFGACVYIALRTLREVNPTIILFHFGNTAIMIAIIVLVFLDEHHLCIFPCQSHNRWLMLALGVFSFLGQFLVTLALRWEDAGPVAISRTADIGFAFIWQILFFKPMPSWTSATGALLITLSVILTGLRTWVSTLPPGAPALKRLGWLTNC